MKNKQETEIKTAKIPGKSIACNGALLSVAAVFAYSLAVLVYAIIRSSITIVAIFPKDERNLILLANGFSIAYAVIFFSLLTAAVSSICGFVAAIILKIALQYFNPLYIFRKAILISIIMGLVMIASAYTLFYALLKDRMTFIYPETFLFWFVFPAIIFFVICIIGGRKINDIFKTMELTKVDM